MKRQAELAQKQLDLLERQLAEFYWPLYLRLEKDNAVWGKILHRDDRTDPIRQKIAWQIESEFLLPNHEAIIKIVEEKIHLANPDDILLGELLAYIRHVAVFSAPRSAEIQDRDPIALGEPYPKDLFPLVRERTIDLQKRYDGRPKTLLDQLRRKPRMLPTTDSKQITVASVTPESAGQ
jgi:hypothetical protein